MSNYRFRVAGGLLVGALMTAPAMADWYFRGTPNDWSTQAMNTADGSIMETCQTFADGDDQGGPRFKIDRYGDWSENYPVSDYLVDSHTAYHIEFDTQSHALSATAVADCTDSTDVWYFRGTPNGWSTWPMTANAEGDFEIEVTFDGEDPDPRFKIDHYGDWTEAYPQADYPVDDHTTYRIRFDSDDHSITTTPLAGDDRTAPTVGADPSPGTYSQTQDVVLSVSDNQDPNTSLYYTLNGDEPTRQSTPYSGEVLTAADVGPGIDLTIKTLAVDESGNEATRSFDYRIGDATAGTDFREETIYFLLTARFYDGDSGNNYYNRDRIEPGDPHWRGDFKGLIEQLDYIKDLGFTAIWVTPPNENRSGLDYHGYHAYDWTRVDPRLESTDATYEDFIDAAHAEGLKVIQDVVINHSSQYGIRDQVWIDHLPIKYFVPEGGQQGMIDNDPYFGNLGDYQSEFRDDNDNPVAPAWFRERHTSDPDGTVPLVDPKTGVTVPKPGYDPNRFFGIDSNTLDPAWYHQDGFMAGGDWENPDALQNKHLAGDTIDLATENANVRDYLNQSIKRYLDMGVDAIRVDTAKHVERDELLGYVHEWQAHKPNLFVFGEALVKGLGFGSELGNDNASAVIRPWWYTRTGSDPSNPSGDANFSVIDFPLFSTFRDNITRGSFSGIGGALAWDWTYAEPTELVTFFQNHDVGPDNDFKYRYCCSEENAALAYTLLWTLRGIPTLYYGEEVMFQAGLPQDIQGSDDVLKDTGRAYFGPVLDDPASARAHPLYQHIQRLNEIRHALPALQKGSMDRVNEWGAGMSFTRTHDGQIAAVGLAAGSAQSVLITALPNGTYRDAVTGDSRTVSDGTLQFTVQAYSAGIYVLDGPGQIGQDGPYLR
ncbi:alpha-amylase family glycosyl hydrolase [Saccharospirillum salsuginis]|uniref:Alpha-amylase n=1 Tax=Saccharospirillum salsuginis TaxID=418750 RepID=A0A918JZU5_9GAMM|nr:alpha-amylase family glycosyl hydrolase [Saccharospirillum salsuginis]GGX39825.1 alpha-amylase [Saccharospirillum salsuginis]